MVENHGAAFAKRNLRAKGKSGVQNLAQRMLSLPAAVRLGLWNYWFYFLLFGV
jgi:hypothetical protein